MSGALIQFDKILSTEEIAFCKDVATGMTCTEAFKTHFPVRAAQCKHVTSAAFSLSKKPAVAAFITQLAEAQKQQEISSMVWTREQSIEALHYVINVCKNDITKIQRARHEELEYLKSIVDDPESTPAKVRQCIEKMIKLQQKSDINKVQIAGIIDAVSELNLMHGFNETNINNTKTISFCGEEDMKD